MGGNGAVRDRIVDQFPRNAGAKSSSTMTWAASGVKSPPTRSRRVAASNSKARTSSGESTPLTTSLRTRAWRMRTSISPCASGAAFAIIVVSRVVRALTRTPLDIPVQLLKRSAEAVELIDEMENDIDALVVDSEVAFQIADQMCPSHVRIGERHFGGRLIWNEPLLVKPELQRLY